MVKGGFGSDIDGVETAPIYEGDADGTERVLETESPGVDGERMIDLNKTGNMDGDTMRIEDDTNVQETEKQIPLRCEDSPHHPQLSQREVVVKTTGDAEPGGITTQDLLASEVAGSWACSTAPSVYGDNDTPQNDERENHAVMNDSNTQVDESQNTCSGALAIKLHSHHEIRALSNMIGIMEPDVKEQFGSFADNRSHEKISKVSNSDSETDDECVEASKSMVDADGSGSDDETQANDQADKNAVNVDQMDDDDDSTDEDSMG